MGRSLPWRPSGLEDTHMGGLSRVKHAPSRVSVVCQVIEYMMRYSIKILKDNRNVFPSWFRIYCIVYLLDYFSHNIHLKK